MKTQEEIFNSVGALTYDLKSLCRYVQNDLDYMIRNSDTNLNLLKENKAKFIEDVQEFADSLYEVCKDIANIYDEAITNYDTIKGKPKHIHQSLESAQKEAKRLCKSGLCEVMVLEVVSKYQAKVIVEEV